SSARENNRPLNFCDALFIPCGLHVGNSEIDVYGNPIRIEFHSLLKPFDGLVILLLPFESHSHLIVEEKRKWVLIPGPLHFFEGCLRLTHDPKAVGVMMMRWWIIGIDLNGVLEFLQGSWQVPIVTDFY